MVNLKILKQTVLIGIVFQLVLIGCAKAWPWFRRDLLFGCMLVAGITGLLYARELARGFLAGALGGAIGGAAGGVAAVSAANLLGERPDIFLPYAVLITAFTGAVGGLFGQADALMQAFFRTLR
jgi:hypothetical protein